MFGNEEWYWKDSSWLVDLGTMSNERPFDSFAMIEDQGSSNESLRGW